MTSSRMMRLVLPSIFLAGSSMLWADTVTDTTLNVTYTETSTFTPVTDNTYDVFLAVDATGFSAGTGFLTAIATQFAPVPTSVSLVAAPGGVGSWSSEIVGGLNSGGCNGTGNFECFQYTNTTNTTNTAVPASSVFNFEFAVTLPSGDSLSAASDIKAAYNTATDNSGTNLGLTSMGIDIQPIPSSVPEPASFLLLGSGLFGFGLLSRRIRKRS